MLSLNCHTADEEVTKHRIQPIAFIFYKPQCHQIPLEASDWVMIGVIIFFGVLVIAGTLVDLVINILQLDDIFSERAVQFLQGFSLYTNTIKLFHCPEPGKEGSLDCIHGIRSSIPSQGSAL